MRLNRQSQRKKDHDYSQPGYYSVTVCTHGRSYLLGKIDDGHMLPNDAGRMINDTWCEIPQHYSGIEIDQMQIMPNHLHGIIVICEVGAAPRGRPTFRMDNGDENSDNLERSSHSAITRGLNFQRLGGHRDPPLRGPFCYRP